MKLHVLINVEHLKQLGSTEESQHIEIQQNLQWNINFFLVMY